MKTTTKLAVLSLGLLLPLTASAVSSSEAYIAAARRGPGIPVPATVVAPIGHTAAPGDVAVLEFTVNAEGRPTNVRVKSSTDESLAFAARRAVKEWRFDPAEVDGRPVAVKVSLPFEVADPKAAATVAVADR